MSKLALVTGASSGIGKETSRLLGAAGWRVVLMARRKESLQELAADIGDNAIVEPCDGGDGEAVLAMAARVLEQHGVPDALVHCAGAGQWKETEDTPPAEIAQMMAAPFFSAFHVSHAFLKPMIERGSGGLFHINSPSCLFPWAGSTGYAAARWALRGLHEAMWQDLKGTGVHSCHLIFGEVSSSYFDANPGSHEKLPVIGKLIPVSTPEQCAQAVVRSINRPSRQVTYPFMLTLFYWSSLVLPGLVRALVTWTQRKR